MNRIHHWICWSNRWKRALAAEVFPGVLNGEARFSFLRQTARQDDEDCEFGLEEKI